MPAAEIFSDRALLSEIRRWHTWTAINAPTTPASRQRLEEQAEFHRARLNGSHGSYRLRSICVIAITNYATEAGIAAEQAMKGMEKLEPAVLPQLSYVLAIHWLFDNLGSDLPRLLGLEYIIRMSAQTHCPLVDRSVRDIVGPFLNSWNQVAERIAA